MVKNWKSRPDLASWPDNFEPWKYKLSGKISSDYLLKSLEKYIGHKDIHVDKARILAILIAQFFYIYDSSKIFCINL